MPSPALSLDDPPEKQAAAALDAGDAIVVIGARGRGFFLHAAALATVATVNRTILWGRGLTCFSVTPERAMRLGLLLAGEYAPGEPVFLRSVEAADCQGTGISAADRAATLRAAGAADAGITSLKSPGHVIPAMVGDGEGDAVPAQALALLRRLTVHDVPAWTDILDDAGELAGTAYCRELAARLGLTSLDITG